MKEFGPHLKNHLDEVNRDATVLDFEVNCGVANHVASWDPNSNVECLFLSGSVS